MDQKELESSALAAMSVVSGTDLADAGEADREDAFVDLLTNLLHYAGQQGWDFRKLLDTAKAHHREETRG